MKGVETLIDLNFEIQSELIDRLSIAAEAKTKLKAEIFASRQMLNKYNAASKQEKKEIERTLSEYLYDQSLNVKIAAREERERREQASKLKDELKEAKPKQRKVIAKKIEICSQFNLF